MSKSKRRSKAWRRAIIMIAEADLEWGAPVRHLIDRFPGCDWCNKPDWRPEYTILGDELIDPEKCPRCAILVAYAIGRERAGATARRIQDAEDALHARSRARGSATAAVRELDAEVLAQTKGRSEAAQATRAAAWHSLGLEGPPDPEVFKSERRRRSGKPGD